MSYCLNPHCRQPKNHSNAERCQTCGSGLLLADRYRAIRPIGQGGFGRTFLAIDEYKPSQPRCVIKQFLPQMVVGLEKAAELFRQEAKQLQALGKHPQIPELLAHLDIDQHQYLVQEWINGSNLEAELLEQGPFSEKQIREVLEDLLPVLQFIHSRQVIHRDIKPENIIRRRGGKLVLVDFGAAKAMTPTALEQTGTSIGSAGYAAPEQTIGKAMYASDIYSLGVTCIHLLTQLSPFELYSVQDGAWHWRDYLPQPVTNQLAYVLDGMLETAVRQRYQAADQVRRDLMSRTPSVVMKYRHDQAPPAPPAINIDCTTERMIVVAFVVGVFLILGRLQTGATLVTIAASLALIGYILTQRFQSSVGVAEKFRLLEDAQSLKQQIRRLEQDMGRLVEQRDSLAHRLDQQMREAARQQRECDAAENAEIGQIETALKKQLSRIQSQRRQLEGEEATVLKQRLQTLQAEHQTRQMASYTLADAKIPGIGKAMKQALHEAGIFTAADIDWERVTQVSGVGEAKAANLMSWRQAVEAEVMATMPHSLSPVQDEHLRASYRQQIEQLIQQENRIRQTARRDRDTILQSSQQQRDRLARELREKQEHLQAAFAVLTDQLQERQEQLFASREALARLQQGLEAYRQISFAAYLRQILFIEQR